MLAIDLVPVTAVGRFAGVVTMLARLAVLAGLAVLGAPVASLTSLLGLEPNRAKPLPPHRTSSCSVPFVGRWRSCVSRSPRCGMWSPTGAGRPELVLDHVEALFPQPGDVVQHRPEHLGRVTLPLVDLAHDPHG